MSLISRSRFLPRWTLALAGLILGLHAPLGLASPWIDPVAAPESAEIADPDPEVGAVPSWASLSRAVPSEASSRSAPAWGPEFNLSGVSIDAVHEALAGALRREDSPGHDDSWRGRFAAGARDFPRPDDDPTPKLGLDLRLGEDLRLATREFTLFLEAGLFGGARATLAAEFDSIGFGSFAHTEVPAARLPGGQVSLSGELEWRTSRRTTVSLGGGLTAWRHWSQMLGGDEPHATASGLDPDAYALITLRFNR